MANPEDLRERPHHTDERDTYQHVSRPSGPAPVRRVELEPLEPGLDSRYYTDPRVADLEQRRIFDRTWQLVGHVTDLPNPGSRIVGSVGTKEVVVVRTEDGSIRAHLNTCRHRGTRLVAGPGEEKALRCPYHGWTYHLDGTLVGAPENRTIPCLDKSKLSLFSARAEVFCGLIFVNLDPAAEPLGPQLEGVRPLLERYLGGEMEPFGEARIHVDDPEHIQQSNWKIAVDNYLEGYHVPVAHPGLMRLLDYKSYSVETARHLRGVRRAAAGQAVGQLGRASVPATGPPDAGPRRRRSTGVFRYIAIYPNTVIDLYPDHVLIWKMNPRGVDRVVVPGTYLRRKDCDLRTRIAQQLNLYLSKITTHEDEDLVQRMQIGLGNTDFRPGPLSLREKGVAWFAGRIRTDLGDLDEEVGPMTDSETMTRRTRAEIAAETREAILNAACEVIADIGFENVRMRIVAERAGVSTAALHYHFDTREKLFAEALRYSFDHTGRDVYEARSSQRLRDQPAGPHHLGVAADDGEPAPGVGDVSGVVVPGQSRAGVAGRGHRAQPRAAGLDRGDAGRRHRVGRVQAVLMPRPTPA